MGETEGPSVDEARCSLGSVLVGEVGGPSANLQVSVTPSWSGRVYIYSLFPTPPIFHQYRAVGTHSASFVAQNPQRCPIQEQVKRPVGLVWHQLFAGFGI